MASIELSLASNAIALQNTIENGALGELGRSFGLQGGKRPGDAVFSSSRPAWRDPACPDGVRATGQPAAPSQPPSFRTRAGVLNTP